MSKWAFDAMLKHIDFQLGNSGVVGSNRSWVEDMRVKCLYMTACLAVSKESSDPRGYGKTISLII